MTTMFEQVAEWDDATGGAESLEIRLECWREETQELEEAIDEGDLPHIAKELCDVVFTALALAKGYGIPFDAVWAEVMRTNFAKIGPDGEVHRRADGKIVKPPGWEAPNLESIVVIDSTIRGSS